MSRFKYLAALMVLLVSATSFAVERVGDFALLDQDGYFHQMSRYSDHSAVVLLVQANGSESFKKSLPDFTRLKAAYEEQDLEFFLLNPMGKLNRDAVAAEMAALGADIPVLMDDAQIVANALGITRISEALVYDPNTFSVLFRGTVGPELEQALAAVAAGRAVSTSEVALQGESVSYGYQSQQVSYADDVAPIIAENCAKCHKEGGIAPFALDSHTMAQGWSPMIREVVMTKRMPPAQVDPHIGNFSNAMNLTDADVQKLMLWIDAGSPMDGTVDPLAELTWPASEWAFGEPDFVIEIPQQSVPATGVLDYINLVVPIEIDEDKWVRGSQYVAGDHTVLHHTITRVIGPDGDRQRRGGSDDVANIAGYVPGGEPRMEQPNTGGLLKKGSSLAVQLHYTTNGRETTDASKVGLWFYPDGVVPDERMSGQCACIFTADWTDIPPHHPNFEQTASIVIPQDAYLYGHYAHMHFRGKYMRFYADYPDGSREELLNVANYSYNWQLTYDYEEPKFVPAGTRITAVGAFDNSAQNPANPDPSQTLGWGEQSWDEMFFGSSRWKYVDQGSD